MSFQPYPLPDGRVLLVSVTDESGRDRPELGPVWEIQIEGHPDEVLSGHPLNSSIAELLGWRVSHEEWPQWINQHAAQIESDFAAQRATGRAFSHRLDTDHGSDGPAGSAEPVQNRKGPLIQVQMDKPAGGWLQGAPWWVMPLVIPGVIFGAIGVVFAVLQDTGLLTLPCIVGLAMGVVFLVIGEYTVGVGCLVFWGLFAVWLVHRTRRSTLSG